MSQKVTAASRAEAVIDALGILYHNDLDPEEFMLFPDSEADTVRLETEKPVTSWQQTYGDQDAFSCLVRTILSQNTSDAASQPAFESLLDRFDDPKQDLATQLATTDQDELAETIQSAGLYNQKAKRLIRIANRIIDNCGSADAFDRFVAEEEPETVRETLLDMSGVGPKTADCVLLFAGGRAGVFPVDTHIHRIYRRMGIAPADADHETVREVLERDVPADKCGFGHTASIQFGREYCSARQPACVTGDEGCPIVELCDQHGVDPETGTVIDPREVEE